MSASGLKVLYVEDDENISMVAKLAMRTFSDYEVLHCSSGKDAVAQFSSFAPDVVLLDVMMPEMDGIATFGHLQELESFRQTPVVFMTARVRKEEVAEYMRLGAFGVITKPFDPSALCANIDQLLQEKAHG